MTIEKYSLQVGKAGEERLQLVNKLYNPASQRFLQNCGLNSAKRVLEVGCGTGIMTCWLAKQIISSGIVVAIDTSEEQLTIAKNNAAKEGLNNIEFKCLSVYDLKKLQAQFDLAYCRWVLVHLTQPVKALTAMHSVLEPGGTLVCEDINFSSFFSYPESAPFQRAIQTWVTLYNVENKDPNIANHLYGYLKDLNCKNIQAAVSQPVLNSAYEKMLHVMALTEQKIPLLENKILTSSEYEDLVAQMTEFAHQESFVVNAYNVLVAGIKEKMVTTQ